MGNLIKLFRIFSKPDKRKFILITVLMLFGAIAETLSIGLIVPFIGIIADPKTILSNDTLNNIFVTVTDSNIQKFVILCSITLLFLYILKNSFLVFFNFFQSKEIFRQQAVLSYRLLNSYMYKDYSFHLKKNSSELLRNVNTEVSQLISGVILPGLLVCSEGLIALSILGLILFIEPVVTVFVIVFLGVSSGLFMLFFKKKIDEAGIQQKRSGELVFKSISQSLHGIKIIKAMGKESFFSEEYKKHVFDFVKFVSYNSALGQMPRIYLESLMVIGILFITIIVIFQGRDIKVLTPLLALFGVSAIRIMPSLNRIVVAITSIRYYSPSIDVVYSDLGVTNEQYRHASSSQPIGYKDCIELVNVSYKYPDSELYTLHDISLKVPIGSSVAFIGSSGAGKTTLVDVILGLLKITEGELRIDGISIYENISAWQRHIGYVPQVTYLIDDTIRNNIAFGVDPALIDDDKVWEALEYAQLKDFIMQTPEGINTIVGEFGVRLSGGQRQRLGIARALYNEPEILILDEATSAVDNETEKEIMSSIEKIKGERTIIIITHRINTIQNCDYIFEIKDGRTLQSQKQ